MEIWKKKKAGYLDNMEEQYLVLKNLNLGYRIMATDGVTLQKEHKERGG